MFCVRLFCVFVCLLLFCNTFYMCDVCVWVCVCEYASCDSSVCWNTSLSQVFMNKLKYIIICQKNSDQSVHIQIQLRICLLSNKQCTRTKFLSSRTYHNHKYEIFVYNISEHHVIVINYINCRWFKMLLKSLNMWKQKCKKKWLWVTLPVTALTHLAFSMCTTWGWFTSLLHECFVL